MSEKETTFVFCASEFVNDARQDEFVRVAPYCDAPQYDQTGQKVVQRFTFESAKKLVDAFNANAKRLLTRLGFANASVPFYNGHPDFANTASIDGDAGRDVRVYAEAEALEAREDGLYAKIKRTAFLEDLKNALGKLEISPRWICERNAIDGTFNPVRLLSFGLVKRGNLPGADLINQKQEEQMTKEQLEQMAALLGLKPEETTPEMLVSAIETIVKQRNDLLNTQSTVTEETDKEKARADKAEADAEQSKKAADESKAKADEEEEKRKKTEKDFANFLLEKALENKRITPAMRKSFDKLFDADFANARTTLESLPVHPDFANDSKTSAEEAAEKDAEKRSAVAKSRDEAGKELAEMANAKLEELKKENPRAEFIDALNCVVSTPKGRELFEAAHKIA